MGILNVLLEYLPLSNLLPICWYQKLVREIENTDAAADSIDEIAASRCVRPHSPSYIARVAQLVEHCTYEVKLDHARVSSSILGMGIFLTGTLSTPES